MRERSSFFARVHGNNQNKSRRGYVDWSVSSNSDETYFHKAWLIFNRFLINDYTCDDPGLLQTYEQSVRSDFSSCKERRCIWIQISLEATKSDRRVEFKWFLFRLRKKIAGFFPNFNVKYLTFQMSVRDHDGITRETHVWRNVRPFLDWAGNMCSFLHQSSDQFLMKINPQTLVRNDGLRSLLQSDLSFPLSEYSSYAILLLTLLHFIKKQRDT